MLQVAKKLDCILYDSKHYTIMNLLNKKTSHRKEPERLNASNKSAHELSSVLSVISLLMHSGRFYSTAATILFQMSLFHSFIHRIPGNHLMWHRPATVSAVHLENEVEFLSFG